MAWSQQLGVDSLLKVAPLNTTATLLAGSAGLDRAVTEVVLKASDFDGEPTQPGVLVVVDGATIANHAYRLDRAIRSISAGDGAGVIVVSATQLDDIGPIRVAEQLGVPLLQVDRSNAADLAFELRGALWAPEVEAAAAMGALLRRLGALHNPGRAVVVEQLSVVTGVEFSLVDRDGNTIAGSDVVVAGRRLAQTNGYHVDFGGPTALYSFPVVVAPGEAPTYWLVAESGIEGGARSMIAIVGQVATWYLTSIVAAARVQGERDARNRIAILNQVLDSAESAEAELRLQLDAVGWTVHGWNTGIHLKLGGADASRVLELRHEMSMRLRDAGIVGPLIERSDGWSAWVNEEREPATLEYTELVERLQSVARAFTGDHPAFSLYGGVGRPGLGASGLRTSLHEAGDASVLAAARSRDRSEVVHIDHLGVQRVLLGWFGSDDFKQFGRSMLHPLLAGDRNGELMATLEAYLDCGGSASAAASSLQIHRNTVNNRIAKVRDLLDVDLEDPEVRLSLQLATRVSRLE